MLGLFNAGQEYEATRPGGVAGSRSQPVRSPSRRPRAWGWWLAGSPPFHAPGPAVPSLLYLSLVLLRATPASVYVRVRLYRASQVRYLACAVVPHIRPYTADSEQAFSPLPHGPRLPPAPPPPPIVPMPCPGMPSHPHIPVGVACDTGRMHVPQIKPPGLAMGAACRGGEVWVVDSTRLPRQIRSLGGKNLRIRNSVPSTRVIRLEATCRCSCSFLQ